MISLKASLILETQRADISEASGREHGNYPLSNLIDNNPGTAFATAEGGVSEEWVTITLKQSVYVVAVVLINR